MLSISKNLDSEHLAPTPIKLSVLMEELQFYEDGDGYIMAKSFANGFDLHNDGLKFDFEPKNLKSATENAAVVR